MLLLPILFFPLFYGFMVIMNALGSGIVSLFEFLGSLLSSL